MFGWFRPSCPVDRAAKVWIEERLEWLTREFPENAFSGEPIILPTPEFFPDRYDQSEEGARKLLDAQLSFVTITTRDLKRQVTVLEDCWTYFDKVVATAPAVMTRGPRGGGRDRDPIATHVREAERRYCSALGSPLPPRTPWVEQRAVIVSALLSNAPAGKWPPRYSLRRMGWHVLDHAPA